MRKIESKGGDGYEKRQLIAAAVVILELSTSHTGPKSSINIKNGAIHHVNSINNSNYNFQAPS